MIGSNNGLATGDSRTQWTYFMPTVSLMTPTVFCTFSPLLPGQRLSCCGWSCHAFMLAGSQGKRTCFSMFQRSPVRLAPHCSVILSSLPRISLTVEVDATALGTFRIGQASKAFQEEIAQWTQKHPGKKRPIYFLCHLRIAGCLECGAEGKVILKELPLVFLAPGSRPHWFFSSSSAWWNPKERVHADGNKAWKSQALKQGFQFSAVSHVRMQFTKRVRSKKLLTGTQKLDGCWKLLKKFVAPRFRTRDPKDRRVAKHLLDTVRSFMFRHNCGYQLWSQLGKLAKEHVWNHFFTDDLQNTWKNTVKIEKKGLPSRACHANFK